MSIINSDKSIEYNVILTKVERMITDLAGVGVDTSEFSNEVKKIVAECNNSLGHQDITIGPVQSLIETSKEYAYQKAITGLQKIKSEIVTYSIYFEASEFCRELEEALNRNKALNSAEIDEYANRLVQMIRSINSSDTRDYQKQEKIVTKIYGLAYELLKCELRTSSTSIIFDEAMANPIVNSYIHREIEEELERLDSKNWENQLAKDYATKIRSKSLDYTYVDIELLNLISNIRELGRCSHASLLNKIQELEKDIKYNQTNVDFYQNSIKTAKKPIFGPRFFATLISLFVAGAVFMSGASQLISKYAVKKIFPTKKDIYTTDTQQTPNVEPYQEEQLEVGETTYIIEYGPWDKGFLQSSYHRDVTTYNVSEIELETLPEYLELDLEELGYKGTTEDETKETLQPEDLYEEPIYEVIKYIQDLDSAETIRDEFDFYFLHIVALFAEVALVAILLNAGKRKFPTFDKILDYDRWMKFRKNKKEEAVKYEEELKKYTTKLLELCAEHKEAAKTFIEMYDKYLKYLSKPELKEEYIRLIRKYQ